MSVDWFQQSIPQRTEVCFSYNKVLLQLLYTANSPMLLNLILHMLFRKIQIRSELINQPDTLYSQPVDLHRYRNLPLQPTAVWPDIILIIWCLRMLLHGFQQVGLTWWPCFAPGFSLVGFALPPLRGYFAGQKLQLDWHAFKQSNIEEMLFCCLKSISILRLPIGQALDGMPPRPWEGKERYLSARATSSELKSPVFGWSLLRPRGQGVDVSESSNWTWAHTKLLRQSQSVEESWSLFMVRKGCHLVAEQVWLARKMRSAKCRSSLEGTQQKDFICVILMPVEIG